MTQNWLREAFRVSGYGIMGWLLRGKGCLFLLPILIRTEPRNLLELPVKMLHILIAAALSDVRDRVGGHGEQVAGALNAASYYILNHRDTEQLLINMLEI